ncbi:MAG: Gfo/Idh/MocA family oxidoreductase [Protaetiibacter sp.]
MTIERTVPAVDTAFRAAVVGTGMIGAVHRRAMAAAGATVVGVVGSSPERGSAAARAWGVPDAITDFEVLLDSEVDVVHICTPNANHVDYALRAIEAGRHVIVEKPVGLSHASALEVEAAASRAGVVVTVPFVYRFHPVVREIRARIAAGALGRIHTVHGSYLQDWLLSPAATSWRVDAALGGPSRAFADIGSHWIDLVEWVSGVRFTDLTAQTAIVVPERPAEGPATFAAQSSRAGVADVNTEDSAVALLRAPGVLGNVTVSQLAAARKNRLWFELDGTAGSAAFDQEQAETAWFGDPAGAHIFARNPSAGSAEQRRLSILPAGHAQGYAECFAAFVGDSYRLMAGHRVEGVPTISDGVRAARVVEAVLESAANGSWVPIEKGLLR